MATVLTILVHIAWIGVASAFLAEFAIRYLPALNAATRYVICWTALGMAALLPVALTFSSDPEAAQPQPPAYVSIAKPAAPLALEAEAPTASPSAPEVQPPALRFPFELHARRALALWITLAWAAGVLFGVARLLREAVVLRRFRARCAGAPAGIQQRFEAWLEPAAGKRPIALVVSGEIAGPLALGFFRPQVALPAALAASLSAPELDQILLHEIAHLRRGDHWAQLFERVLEILLFFHPAVWWLSRRIDLEREIACDDWVIARTGDAREYATCLTRVVELAGFRRGWALAAGAAGSKSHLLRRIELMLDQNRNRQPQVPRFALIAVIAVAGLLLVGAGRLPFVFAFEALTEENASPEPPAPAGLSSDHGRTRIRWSEDGRSTELGVDGSVEFASDDRDVKSLSPNGRFLLETRSGGQTRRYEVRADASGHLTRTYQVDGQTRAPDEAKPWLAGNLPDVIRETGFGAGPRIQRIAEAGGPGAAIREIGLIHSDGAKRVYIEELLSRMRLDDSRLGETMRLVRGIGSDGEKARVLITAAPKYLKPGLRERLFEAIDTIGSDGEHRRALAAVLEADGAGNETAVLAARSAGRIGSDGEKAAVLIQAARPVANDEARRAWFRAVNTIGSDGEHARALLAILDRSNSPLTLAEAARPARRISSDGEKARVLMRIARESLSGAGVRSAFVEAADSISSDGEHARTLLALVGQSGLSDDIVVAAIQSSTKMASDGEKARVLTSIAGNYGRNRTIARELRAAAKSVSSDGEYRRIVSALDRQDPTL